MVVSFWVVFDGKRTSKVTPVLPLKKSTITIFSDPNISTKTLESLDVISFMNPIVKGLKRSNSLGSNGRVHLIVIDIIIGLVLHSPLKSKKPRLQTHLGPCDVDSLHSS